MGQLKEEAQLFRMILIVSVIVLLNLCYTVKGQNCQSQSGKPRFRDCCIEVAGDLKGLSNAKECCYFIDVYERAFGTAAARQACGVPNPPSSSCPSDYTPVLGKCLKRTGDYTVTDDDSYVIVTGALTRNWTSAIGNGNELKKCNGEGNDKQPVCVIMDLVNGDFDDKFCANPQYYHKFCETPNTSYLKYFQCPICWLSVIHLNYCSPYMPANELRGKKACCFHPRCKRSLKSKCHNLGIYVP